MTKQNKLFYIFLSLTLIGLLIMLIPFLLFTFETDDNNIKKEDKNDIKYNKTLEYIFIDRYPFKMQYKEGEKFDSTGLIIRACYDDNSNPQIYEYIIKDNFPLDLYNRYITISYKDSSYDIEIEIINDENIIIMPNLSFEEYIIKPFKDSINRFEMEDSDISYWYISNTNGNNKIISRNDSSQKKYLSGIDKNVLKDSKLFFNINLEFDSDIEMSVSYSQREEYKNIKYDMTLIYIFILDENITIEINENEKYLNPRSDITKWQIIKYKSFKLSKGVHNITIKSFSNKEFGTPNIDYIDLKTFEIKNKREDDIPINDFHTFLQYQYIKESDPLKIWKYVDGNYELSKPRGNILDFSDSIEDYSETYIIEISDNQNFENSKKIFNLKEKKYILKNLKLGQKIYYRGAITQDELNKTKIYVLITNNLGPRNLDIPGVKNFRDIGGYKTSLIENCIIEQGLFYRSAQLNDITNKGKEILIKDLGIKAEIDLREQVKNTGPYIDGIKYYPISIDIGNQDERFEKLEEQYYKVFSLISKADINPIILHCMAGADRTGIMSFALLTLLGCDYNDIARDYLFTNFSNDGCRYVEGEFNNWWKKLSQYKGDTKAEQCKNWLMSKGLEGEKLEYIRSIFIKGYKEK